MSLSFAFKFAATTVAALLLVGITLAAPFREVDDPELSAGYFEGDLILSSNQRNGLIDQVHLWPKAKVYYAIDKEVFDAQHVNHILRGIRIIETISCVRFYPADSKTPAYINITGNPDGCYSAVGYQGKVQTMNLQIRSVDFGCFRFGTIVHEFLHALGFFHQQSASDRDDWVKIVKENIVKGWEHNFDKFNESYITNFGIDYDYGSVLHYNAYAFSKNGEPTIIPLKRDGSTNIGQRRGMSKKDIDKLNIMYKCPVYV